MVLKSYISSFIVSCLFLMLSNTGFAASPGSCSVGPQVMRDGESAIFFKVPSVHEGGSCAQYALKRTCRNGSMSPGREYRYGSCTVLERFTGVNLNEFPRQMENRATKRFNAPLFSRSGVETYRGTMEVLRYRKLFLSGKMKPRQRIENKWASFIAASRDHGKKAILSLEWSFKHADMAPPLPGSQEERDLFAFLDTHVLDILAPSASIITSGNEPFVDTKKEDWRFNPRYGGIPMVEFYKRVTQHVHAYLVRKGLRGQVALYMGSFTQLYSRKMQDRSATRALFAYADAAPFVDGVDLHAHVTRLDQIESALAFARFQTAKPIIVTEYTYVWKMRRAIESDDRLGEAFAGRWGYDPFLPIHDYLVCYVFQRGNGCQFDTKISKAEWDDFLASRPWFIDHFLLKADNIFRKYDVHGVTYGFMQRQPSNRQLQRNKAPWYLGFLYSPASLGYNRDGFPLTNYQVLDDFISLQR